MSKKVLCNHSSVNQINAYSLYKFDLSYEIGYCDDCGNLVAAPLGVSDDGIREEWITITKLERRRETLTKGLASLLLKMRTIVFDKGENLIDMSADTKHFTHSQYASVQKLRYWGLVHWVPNEAGLKRKTGMWLITRNGAKWLKGEMTMPKHIWVQNNKVVQKEEEIVTFRDIIAGDNVPVWTSREDILYDLGQPEGQVPMF